MLPTIPQVTRFCPAKLNLRLAVVGRRADGFHELSSVVTPLSLGDALTLSWLDTSGAHSLRIEGSSLQVDADNLVLRAIRAFAEQCPFPGRIAATLQKRIPVGAGLGGGSSDAAGTLLGLQAMWGNPLDKTILREIALKLGADVPFFLQPAMAVMRGVGEQLTPAPAFSEALRGFHVLVFKPSLGISTVWAYRALAQARAYQDPAVEAARLEAVASGREPPSALPFNAFRAVVDRRYPTLPLVLGELNRIPGVRAEMSGNGSACFALCEDPDLLIPLQDRIRSAWGENAFAQSISLT